MIDQTQAQQLMGQRGLGSASIRRGKGFELETLCERDDYEEYRRVPRDVPENTKFWRVRAELLWDSKARGLAVRLSVACECSWFSHHAVIENKAVTDVGDAEAWISVRTPEIMAEIEARLDAALQVDR